jgi:hypothetical protein
MWAHYITRLSKYTLTAFISYTILIFRRLKMNENAGFYGFLGGKGKMRHALSHRRT